MLRLSEAPFDRNDASLVPSVGSCKDCPKRTGCQPELFEDVRAKDSCIDLACFNSKVAANWAKAVARADRQGLAVLPPKEVRKLYYGRTDRISHGAAYVDPGSVNHRDPQRRTWKALLGKHAPPLVLAQNPLGAPVRLLSRAAAEAKLAELRISFEQPEPIDDLDRDVPLAEARHARDVAGRAARAVLTRIANRFREEGIYPEVWATVMRLVLERTVDCAREPDSQERHALIEDALTEPDVRELQAFMLEDFLGAVLHIAYDHGERPEELVALAAIYQIDYGAIEKNLADAPAAAA